MSSPIAIFGMMSLVLKLSICCRISSDVIRMGVRREMNCCVGWGCCVAAWWEAVEIDLSEDVRARLDVLMLFMDIWLGCWLLTWSVRVCSVMMLRSSWCCWDG